jgi:hypothetical protein
LSKWGQQTVDGNPDMAKARRRVKSLEPQYRFCFPTAVEFDTAADSVIVADSQRNRLQNLQESSRPTATSKPICKQLADSGR